MTRFWPVTAARRRLAASALLAGAAGLSTTGYFVATALASPAAPALGSPASYSQQAGRSGASPSTVIISAPAQTTRLTSAHFVFVSPGRSRVTFSCRLDAAPVTACSGPTSAERHFAEGEQTFTHLALGRHCFHVFATGQNGSVGRAARYCWTIIGSRRDFTVGGDLTALLYPGTSQSLDLTFTNASSVRLTIADGAISPGNITITSDAPGCSASNFTVVQGLTATVTIPARQHTAVSLSALRIPQGHWPVIKMLDTQTNQDACQGATLRLSYSGIEATG